MIDLRNRIPGVAPGSATRINRGARRGFAEKRRVLCDIQPCIGIDEWVRSSALPSSKISGGHALA